MSGLATASALSTVDGIVDTILSRQVLHSTTIASVAGNQLSYVLTAGLDTDQSLRDTYAIVTDAGSGTNKSIVEIVDYDQSTLTVVLRETAVFTVAATDTIEFFHVAPITIQNANALIIDSGDIALVSGDDVRLDSNAPSNITMTGKSILVYGDREPEVRTITSYNPINNDATPDSAWNVSPTTSDRYLILGGLISKEATDTSGLATAAALATVDGIVDGILVDTGTTLPSIVDNVAGSVVPVSTKMSSTIPSTVSIFASMSFTFPFIASKSKPPASDIGIPPAASAAASGRAVPDNPRVTL